MLVALGAAMFKPVIIGTVSKTTGEKTSSMGFGIFYMMVNIGGFVGPIVAGIVRGWSWEYVFIASSGWIFINLIIVLIFFKEPQLKEAALMCVHLKQVLQDMVEVLGNGRFFLFVFGLLLVLVLGSKFTSDGSFTWMEIIYFVIGWTALNFIYDFFLKKSGRRRKEILVCYSNETRRLALWVIPSFNVWFLDKL